MTVEAAKVRKLFDGDVKVGGALELASAMRDVTYALHPVLVAGHLITLTAHPGHGKSTTASAMAYSLALRRQWGRLDPDPFADGLVYLVSAEDTEGTRLRIFAEAAHRKLSENQRADINTFLRWMHVTTTLHPQLILAEIEKDAHGAGVSAVLVDTGPALFAGDDENSNTLLQAYATSWRPMTMITGRPCVVLLWHPAKNATADNLVPRGGSSLLGAVDANLTLWKDDDVITLSYTKLRSEHFEPLRFKLQPVQLELPSGALRTIPIATPVDDQAGDTLDAERIQRRGRLLVAMLGGGVSIAKLSAAVGASAGTVHADLVDMAKSRRAPVAKDAISSHYALTEQGMRDAKAIAERDAQAFRNAKDPG